MGVPRPEGGDHGGEPGAAGLHRLAGQRVSTTDPRETLTPRWTYGGLDKLDQRGGEPDRSVVLALIKQPHAQRATPR